MKHTRVMVWIAMSLFCIAVPFVCGADDSGDTDEENLKSEWDYSSLGKSEFGSVVYGPEFTKAQLKGKVVLVVRCAYWTTDINGLKDAAKLAAKYRKRGFIVIGVKDWSKKNGKSIVTMAVDMKIKSVPIVEYFLRERKQKKYNPTDRDRGFYYPRGILYGRDGNIVWEHRYVGVQKEMDRLLKRELKKKSGVKSKKANDYEKILDGGEFPKSLGIVKQIKAGRLGAAYRKCEKNSDKQGDVGTEATELKELLEGYHQQQIELFQEQKTDAPTDAMKTLGGISKTFRGTKFSKEAQKNLTELKKDKEFQTRLKSYRECERILGMIGKIPDPPADDDDHKKWKRKYKAKIAGLGRKVEAFRKKHPDSPFIKKLEDAMIPLDTEM